MQRVIENQRKIESGEALQELNRRQNLLNSQGNSETSTIAPSTSRSSLQSTVETNPQPSDDSLDSDDSDSDEDVIMEATNRNVEEDVEDLIDENDSDYEDIVDHLRHELNPDLDR